MGTPSLGIGFGSSVPPRLPVSGKLFTVGEWTFGGIPPYLLDFWGYAMNTVSGGINVHPDRLENRFSHVYTTPEAHTNKLLVWS